MIIYNNVCFFLFSEDTYSNHTTCISEAEKYGGQGFKAKPVAVKQNAWLTICQKVLESRSLTGPQHKLLEECSKLNNIPRNKKKFHVIILFTYLSNKKFTPNLYIAI